MTQEQAETLVKGIVERHMTRLASLLSEGFGAEVTLKCEVDVTMELEVEEAE